MTRTLKITNGDVVIRRSNGRFEDIDGRPKARQQLKRILELDIPWGAGLDSIIGQVPESSFALTVDVEANIRAAFDALVQDLGLYQFAERTTDERLTMLARIFVVPARFGSALSKTGYALRVDALTADGEGVIQSGLLNVPQGG